VTFLNPKGFSFGVVRIRGICVEYFMNLLKLTSCRWLAQFWLVALVAFAPSAGLAQTVVKVAKPKIVLQPVATVSADFGSVVTLSVSATSSETPRYAWTKDGAVLAGATTNSLSITVDEVTVTNTAGAVKSKVSLVKVNLAPASLPAGTALIGTISTTFRGETVTVDGGYVVGVGNVIDDPEETTDLFTYTYARLSNTQARLVVSGSDYDYDAGMRLNRVESFTFTFTAANAAGERQALVKYTGTGPILVGNKLKKFTFNGTGHFSFVPPGVDP
jgi:hypothetical protein